MPFKSLERHFIDSIKYAFEYKGRFPTQNPLFQFSLSREAANQNYSILEQFECNLSNALIAQSKHSFKICVGIQVTQCYTSDTKKSSPLEFYC